MLTLLLYSFIVIAIMYCTAFLHCEPSIWALSKQMAHTVCQVLQLMVHSVYEAMAQNVCKCKNLMLTVYAKYQN